MAYYNSKVGFTAKAQRTQRGRSKVKKQQPFGQDEKIKADPSIVLREEFDNYIFLYDPDTGATCELNPVGAFIWKQLDGRHTVRQIVEKLNHKFDSVSSKALDHLKVFLNDLKAKGYIE